MSKISKDSLGEVRYALPIQIFVGANCEYPSRKGVERGGKGMLSHVAEVEAVAMHDPLNPQAERAQMAVCWGARITVRDEI
jgi:hypothetical protein